MHKIEVFVVQYMNWKVLILKVDKIWIKLKLSFIANH